MIMKRQDFTGDVYGSKILVDLDSRRLGNDRKYVPAPTYRLKLLVKGECVVPGIKTGRVRLVRSVKDVGLVGLGDVMVVRETGVGFLPAIKRAGVVVVELGGRGSHAAITGRL